VLFGERVFCLEDIFMQWQMAQSVYHLRQLADHLGSFLPSGYEQVAYVHCPETDTHCLAVASPDRLLISFRGTVTARNAKTDLDMKLVPLSWSVAGDEARGGDGLGLATLASARLERWKAAHAQTPRVLRPRRLVALRSDLLLVRDGELEGGDLDRDRTAP
jgi:hypothetical protein